jgi:hypothetical protein
MHELDTQQINRSETHPSSQSSTKRVQFAEARAHGACGMDTGCGDANNNAFSVLMRPSRGMALFNHLFPPLVFFHSSWREQSHPTRQLLCARFLCVPDL